MQNQSGKTAALYYRVARKQTDGLLFDNQIELLLCYANKQGLDSFILYADVGKNGNTLDRPALNRLKEDIEAGRIGKLIVFNTSRIARNYILCGEFIEWAQMWDVEIISMTDGTLTEPPNAEMANLFRSLLRGGERA